ncbi:MAG: rhodanese-like domain-containing protein [Gemmataceae bacterium]
MSRLLGFAVAALLMGATLTVVAGEPLKHTKDSLDTVKENLKTGKAVLLDVREQKEWDAGHLAAAKLLPQSKLKAAAGLEELLKTLPKDKVIYTHCRGGNRALTCGEILKKHGFDVRPLKTGYQGLVDAGFEKAAEKK